MSAPSLAETPAGVVFLKLLRPADEAVGWGLSVLAEELTPLAAGDELLESLLRFRNPGEKSYVHSEKNEIRTYTKQREKNTEKKAWLTEECWPKIKGYCKGHCYGKTYGQIGSPSHFFGLFIIEIIFLTQNLFEKRQQSALMFVSSSKEGARIACAGGLLSFSRSDV